MQIDLNIRDMLFINYAAPATLVRAVVPGPLELDTQPEQDGTATTLLSAVAFKVKEVRSALGVVPNLSFDQVNYRTYVRTREGPAVYFFAMKVSSRVVVAGLSFTGLPLGHEEMSGTVEPTEESSSTSRVCFTGESGLDASALVTGSDADGEFITERLIGFASASAGGLLKLTVDHAPLRAVAARIERANVPLFESLGLLEVGAEPRSAFYVAEARLRTSLPAPWLPGNEVEQELQSVG